MNNLNVAEWIIVGILSLTLLVFLILGIILLAKLIGISKQAKKIVETSQTIADKAGDVVDNVKDMTSVGGLAKGYVREYIGEKLLGRDLDRHDDDYYMHGGRSRTHKRRNSGSSRTQQPKQQNSKK